jgi:hypothetical protein
MSVRPIIDAGPGLNFLSIHKERLLIAILGPFSAPETVQGEVLRKSQQDDRFRAAATVWRKLTTRWIQILPDDTTPELATVVQRTWPTVRPCTIPTIGYVDSMMACRRLRALTCWRPSSGHERPPAVREQRDPRAGHHYRFSPELPAGPVSSSHHADSQHHWP